jgi:pyruvate kinase
MLWEMTHRKSPLSEKVLRERLSVLNDRMDAVELDFEALLGTLHPSQRRSGANLLHYLALRSESILELQDALHEFGLSSLASSESHVRHQLSAVRSRLGEVIAHRSHLFTLPEARALMQERTQALFGTRVPGTPHLMVTFERAFLDDADIVERLLRAGMTVARLNCAHDDESTWQALIGLVRAASARTGLSCAIYMDLGGPKLRTVLRGAHRPHRWIEVDEGDLLPFVEADAPLADGEVAVACQEIGIVGQLRIGDRVLFDDGLIEGVVVDAGAERATLRISRVSARKPRLRAEKGMNFPDTSLALPSLTETDRTHLPFIRAYADMVGYSFLRTADDLAVLRTELEGPGGTPHIILKIETREAVQDLPAILLEAMRQPLFGVMIARGDLAVEIGFERLSEIQEEILWLAEAAHAPVIWATQVLETLNKRGIATRAEITDASFAVRAECVLLNKGEHILEVIDTLRDILARSGGHHEKKRYRMRPMSIARRFLEGADASAYRDG